MYCPKCGNKLPDGISTCENCGWSEEVDVPTVKTIKKSFPKKAIIAIAVVLVTLAVIIGTRFLNLVPEKNYDRATAIFNEDGTGSIDPAGDNTTFPWTWKYREDKTEQLNNEALVYEITFTGLENSSIYVIYKDDGFLLTLPKTSSKELTMYFIRADAE